MKEIKYQQKYVRQLVEGGTGTDVSHPCQEQMARVGRDRLA